MRAHRAEEVFEAELFEVVLTDPGSSSLHVEEAVEAEGIGGGDEKGGRCPSGDSSGDSQVTGKCTQSKLSDD